METSLEERVIDTARTLGAAFADARRVTVERLNLEMRDGEPKRIVPGIEDGIGVRVLVDGAWGFFSTNRLDWEELERGLNGALGLARSARSLVDEPAGLGDSPAVRDRVDWRPAKPPQQVELEEKQTLLADMYAAVKDRSEIVTVTTSFSEATTAQHYVSTEGHDILTRVTRILAQTHFIAKKDGRITSRRARIGGTGGFEHFDRRHPADEARDAAEATIRALSAPRAPAGRMTVVTDPDLTGVFTHEAVGHASEADLVLAGDSCLEGRIGEKIAVDGLTIVDDSTIPGAFGSFPYDDNGVKGQRKVIIEDGILQNYLLDRYTAYRLGLQANGAARAEDHAYRPLVRMSNTFIEAGDHAREELFEGIKEGVYALGTRGGQVDTAKGGFQFAAQDAYLIKNGEIAHPLRDVALSGTILETLMNIEARGKDFRIGDPGICGKGQLVPVGDGGPTTRIRDVIVGGTA